ncbi:MAG: PQQ-binding-like beta-propeller repeat protein [Thermoanaerobaculia bacterium]|nr:PQQ-binding-like beta-propeller repeat protein [Thermoanaerobaculia bacterium]
MTLRPPVCAAALLLLAALPLPASDSHWQSWRGPLGTGEAPGASPPVTWSETENVRFKVPIPGRGHASPIVWGDRIYLLTAVETEEPAAPSEEEPSWRRNVRAGGPVRFVVLALDRATGSVVWERTAAELVPHEGTHPHATWASASALTDGEHLFAHFGSRGLYAYTLDGEPLWSVDLGDMSTRNGFGEGSSPVVSGDTLVVNWDHEGDSFVVALDKATGEERWRRARDERTSWSTPIVVEVDGRRQVVVSATGRVRGYDLATGETIWETGGMTVNTIPAPVHRDGMVWVTSGFRGSALKAIRLPGARGVLDGGDAIAWSYDRDTPYVPSPVLYGELLYFLKSNSGILTAVRAETGEVVFGPERLPGIENVYASPVAADGRIYVAGREGTTVVLRHGPSLEVLATNELDDGFDASPAIVGDELFLRGRTHLYAIAESAGGGQGSQEPAPAGGR